MANRHLDRVLSPDYLEDLESWPIEEIRARRAECQRLEDAASYLRRLVQTRIDILGTELQARSNGQEADLEALIALLPSILTESADHRNTTGRLVADELDDIQERWAQSRIDSVCGNVDVEAAPELDDTTLRYLADQLTDLERHVSTERRALHDIFDKLQAELVRRYRTGLATVDGLLR